MHLKIYFYQKLESRSRGKTKKIKSGVECKGRQADRWAAAKDDRRNGGVQANAQSGIETPRKFE